MKVEISTADGDGNRKWVYPIVSRGVWYRRRQVVSVILIAWLLAAPWLKWNGKQLVFFDLISRKIHFFGQTFWVNETFVFLAFIFLLIGILLLMTAIFGRVFCGWACPITVFMEFVFRPIERIIEGMGFHQREFKKLPIGERILPTAMKWSLFSLVAIVLGNTFVAYFFGANHLIDMVRDGPAQHQGVFIAMLSVSGVILFQFGWFREQVCLFVCPYGRLQSVLLDQHSLIVGYDEKRGEPRGRPSQKVGDCVDCKMCIKVCPTGIDIRNGLQLECIHCTQCIDACDDVMEKLNRPPGLIRYQTENETKGLKAGIRNRLLRPRIFGYGLFVLVASGILGIFASHRSDFSATAHREASTSIYTVDGAGLIVNPIHLNLSNHTDHDLQFELKGVIPEGIQIVIPEGRINLQEGQKSRVFLLLKASREAFREKQGLLDVLFEVVSDSGSKQVMKIRLVGPAS